MIRTIAGASRKLDENLNLSPLQAIDRLQKIHAKFHEQWIVPSPWLVLEDCWTIPASMPVPKMLEDMEKHGKPLGIVGAARLKFSQRHAVLRMLFRKDEKSRKTVETSAQAALNDLNERLRAVFSAQVFLDASGDTISMHYSFHPEQPLEPGAKKIGSIVYTADGQIRCLLQNKQFADVLDQAKERFIEVSQKLQQIQRKTGKNTR